MEVVAPTTVLTWIDSDFADPMSMYVPRSDVGGMAKSPGVPDAVANERRLSAPARLSVDSPEFRGYLIQAAMT